MQMLTVVLVIAALLVIVLMSARSRRSEGMGRIGVPYAAKALFTPAERSFLGVLERALDDRHRVFGKVRLADLLVVRGGLSPSDRGAAFNRIKAKHADLVVCTQDELRPVLVIELDDASHGSERLRRRDAFFDDAFAAAGLPVIRFGAKAAYSVHDVRSALALHLGTGPLREAPGAAAPSGATTPT